MASQKKNIMVGLDVGNTNVAAVVMSQDRETGDLNVIGYSSAPVSGMRKGMVMDIDETVFAISKVLEETERMAGTAIEKVFLSISGQQVFSSNSKGVVAVGSPDREISSEDMERAIDSAKAFSLPPNREVIHVIPKTFSVDGHDGIKDPLGMKGIKLEVDAHVVAVSSPVVKNLLQCAYNAGIDLDGFVLSSLAVAKAILTRKQKEIGVVLIDIGGGGTNIAVFEEGEIIHTAFIPIGASNITNDIAIVLKTSIEFAEKVKIDHGAATTNRVAERDSIDLSEIDSQVEKTFVSRKYIVEIINARLEEIFVKVRDELKKIDRDGLLPAGAIITGGGAKMDDIAEVAREILRLPAQVGKIDESIVAIDKEILTDPTYFTAIGLALWGFDMSKDQMMFDGIFKGLKGLGGIFKKISKVFKKR
jgi:cell division protein FtsA